MAIASEYSEYYTRVRSIVNINLSFFSKLQGKKVGTIVVAVLQKSYLCIS